MKLEELGYRRNKRPLVFNLPLEKYPFQSLSGPIAIINTASGAISKNGVSSGRSISRPK